MALIDTHCHLDFSAFDNDRAEVLSRAQQSGLERIINPGIDLENCQALLRLCDTHSVVYAAIGVHPNSALSWGRHSLNQLQQLAQHPKVVAIGEIGLDFYRDRAPKDIQIRIFREQLELAGELSLPVIVHSRQAESQSLEILSEWIIQRKNTSSMPGVLHSYGGDEPTAQRAIQMGLLIGITGPVTFRNASKLHRLVTKIPLDNLLVETDAPFLTPHPHRGERNEPAYVRLIAEKIASLKEQTIEHVMRRTTANADKLFQWS